MPDVHVETCDSALDAVEKIAQSNYDAVISDIKMPGMDGLGLLKEIQAIDPELPTLLITGHGQDDLALQALRGGAFDFIQKPIERDYFVASLTRAIRMRKLNRTLLAQKQALEHQNEELELAVEARTEELRELNQRKDDFLAMLSHELRTPLACILGSAQLALSSQDDRMSVAGRCNVIVQQATHISNMLDDLLDLSRINSSKISIRKAEFRLGEVIDASIAAAQPILTDANHQLKIEIGHELAEQQVYADPTRLEQIIVNLLNNAAKYSNAGGEISLLAHRDGDSVELALRDNGVGIPASELQHIFEPFRQIGRTRDLSKGGLGIGLSLVRTLVELHHGTVTATSDGVGRGSCFVVRLPIISGETDAELFPRESSPQQTSSFRVLLVEDQRALATIARVMLEKCGQQVLAVAENGPQAIEEALTHIPDYIFMDIGLPEMNGYEVAQQLRQYPQLDRTILVAMTGYGSADDKQRAKEAGFAQHLVKPCSLQMLSECLRQPVSSVNFSE